MVGSGRQHALLMDDASCQDAAGCTCGPSAAPLGCCRGAWPDVLSALQVESVLGDKVTEVVKGCLSLMPQNRPTMADIAEEMALRLHPGMLSP